MKKNFFIFTAFLFITQHSIAEEKPIESVIVNLESQLCSEHKNPAKCGKDIAFIVGMASSISHMDGYCMGGYESKSCDEARRAYNFMQKDFEKSKENTRD